ncbi:MAG: exodeoxyribonuclease VII large subunit, partial [Planctomycetes bacterium]|nr:exodeoxyribonuclease VII large subunit [Planctomycetota bacterium]
MTDRLPFDPSKMAAKASVPAPGKLPEGVLSVSGLAGLVDTALKQGVPTGVRVIGEVSGFSDRTHWYFTLKDDEAVVSAVMFASAAARCGFRPRGGERVIATGRVEFFAKQGRTQFYVTRMEPVG